jgi:hypothetical protein
MSLLRCFAFLLTTLFLLPQSAIAEANTVKLSKKQISWIDRGIGKNLKDPDSVKLKDLRARKSPKIDYTIEVCGYYNAKNSFGAYVGYELFYGWLGPNGFMVVNSGSDEADRMTANDNCNEAGLI